MNRIKITTAVVSVLVAVSNFSGAWGQDTSESIENEMIGSVSEEAAIRIESDNFVCIVNQGGNEVLLESLNPKASTDDLYNHIYTKCWNDYLLRKLDKQRKISREDGVLIRYCLAVQEAMILNITAAVFSDMGIVTEDEINGWYDLPNVGTGVMYWLDFKFRRENAGLRSILRDWAKEYRDIPHTKLYEIWKDIKENPNAETERNWDVSRKLMPKEEAAMKLKASSVVLMNKWVSVRNAVLGYICEGDSMRNSLKNCQTGSGIVDPLTRKILRDILAESETRYAEEILNLESVIYDLPLTVLSYRAIGKLKKHKGFWNDNETEMMNTMSEYARAIAGTEMLKNLRTRYAASSYSHAVELFKGELWGGEFKNFQQESKLYRVEVSQRTDPYARKENQLASLDEQGKELKK